MLKNFFGLLVLLGLSFSQAQAQVWDDPSNTESAPMDPEIVDFNETLNAVKEILGASAS